MPDGELEAYLPELSEIIRGLMGRTAIDTIVTTGADGYDNHPDHMAIHKAAVSFSESEGQRLVALDSRHQGEHRITENPVAKLGAMACHQSQFSLHGGQFWNEFSPYAPLIFEQETYSTVSVLR